MLKPIWTAFRRRLAGEYLPEHPSVTEAPGLQVKAVERAV
jgi:hypothetical protein